MGRLPATIRPVKREPKRLPSEQTVSSAVLRFRNTSKVYALARQSVAALTDVTVSVGRGEFVALVGRSGCGKTTFLNLAGALDVPSGGDVLIDGLSTVNLDDAQLTQVRRQRVGFVFQFFRLFPTLSAVENVEVPLQLAGLPGSRARARDLLDLVGMADLGERMPYQLSGGQMQRVAIARALGPSPGMLLADEPTGNLDSETARTIMDLFRRVNIELGTTVIMATHSMANASRAERVIALNDGRLASDESRNPEAPVG